MAKKSPFRLTKETYFSPDKPHISASKAKDYLKDPVFYYKRHVLKDPDYIFKTTDPMIRGSIVDDILTLGSTKFQKKIKKTVFKKDDEQAYQVEQKKIKEQAELIDEKYLVGETVWDQAAQIIRELNAHPLWTTALEDAEFQVVLEGEVSGMPACGLADRINFPGTDHEVMIDLKVVNPIKLDSMQKWLWNVVAMGYHIQAGLYQRLRAEARGVDHKTIKFAHVIAAYSEQGLTLVDACYLPQPLLVKGYEIFERVCADIKAEKFEADNVTWDDVNELPYHTGVENAPIEFDEDEK